MITALLITLLAVIAFGAVSVVCWAVTDGGFFAWCFWVPEFFKGVGCIVAAIFSAIGEINK